MPKLKITLKNETKYRSKDLKMLFEICFKAYKQTNWNLKYDNINVRCIYRRTKDGFCGGYAWYNHNAVVMKLPKEKRPYEKDTFEQRIARTFLHELDHCKGLRHGSMMADSQRNISFLPADISVEPYKEPEKKTKEVADKVTVLLSRRKRWEGKLKRSQNAIRKINKQIKYYELKMVANKNKQINPNINQPVQDENDKGGTEND